jgi:hypothetical protein
MHQLPIEQQVLEVAQIALLLALCAKLWWSGLYKIYIFFFSYLVLEFLQSLIPAVMPVNGHLYIKSYIASQALIVCSYAFVVLELYSVILRNLAGIAGIARRYIKIILAASIVLSLLPLRIEKTPNTWTGYLFIFERPILSSLLIFIFLITAFLVYYPVPISRNAMIYLIGYATYFIGEATAILFLNNLGYYSNRWLSDLTMGFPVACLVFWFICLNRHGEEKRVVVGHQWNPGDDQRLLAQLGAINASLLRSGRKQ